MNIAFPYHLDARGGTATADWDDHIRQMLEQLLFTRPGERVNRANFGCGLLDLVFGPNSPEVAAALTVTVSGAVQQWLGDLIALTTIDISANGSQLLVNVGYEVLATEAAADVSLPLPNES